jgi:uncharacterized membrane protein HdeD (DUF308 family)
MNAAKTAWGILVGLFGVLSVVLFLFSPEDARVGGALIVAWLFAIFFVIGWVVLAVMIFSDERA